MDFQSLTMLYAGKKDEELLQLAEESHQLTFEAQSALRGEMGKRSLEKVGAPIVAAPPAVSIVQKTEVQKTEAPNAPPIVLPVGEFIGEVFRIYHEHLWLFVRLTLPAVLIGMIAILTARHEARGIARYVSRDLSNVNTVLFEVWIVNTAGFLVSWTAFCVAFAAICVAVREFRTGSDISARGVFGAVMTKLGPVLRVSVLLFTIFYVGALATEFILFVVLASFVSKVLNAVPFGIFGSTFVLMMAIALIISRVALAIPAVVLDDFKVGQAFFRSDELTEKKWAILAVLLIKSVLGGYIAGMLPFWLDGWIPAGVHLPSWFSWVLTGASVLAVTYVEPIMFIGFALLYEKANSISLDAPHESATHAASSG